MTDLLNYGLHLTKQAVIHLTPVAWPLAVLIIVLLFLKQLKVLLINLREAKAFGVEIVTRDIIGARLSDELARTIDPFMPSGSGVAGLPGAAIQIGPHAENYYFFGHDLMLCYCALITGAAPEIIKHTLQCAITHLEKFGKDTSYDLTLRRLLEEARKRAEWTEAVRQAESAKIWRISREVGDIIQKGCRGLSSRSQQVDQSR